MVKGKGLWGFDWGDRNKFRKWFWGGFCRIWVFIEFGEEKKES